MTAVTRPRITDDQRRTVMSTDVDGGFYGCRGAIPHLVKSKGCIANTASVSGTGGDWGMAFNNVAKGAVVNLTRALARDQGKKGVRINSVCPSLTRTGLTTDMMDDRELFSERIPLAPRLLRRWPARSLITGANVAVDGGFPPPMVQPPQE
jgi:meso-butanediol dehydrogenase/(S,S)-butanediol dehydrogenase/diacetyl reductase